MNRINLYVCLNLGFNTKHFGELCSRFLTPIRLRPSWHRVPPQLRQIANLELGVCPSALCVHYRRVTGLVPCLCQTHTHTHSCFHNKCFKKNTIIFESCCESMTTPELDPDKLFSLLCSFFCILYRLFVKIFKPLFVGWWLYNMLLILYFTCVLVTTGL